jgi:hypothetical protein
MNIHRFIKPILVLIFFLIHSSTLLAQEDIVKPKSGQEGKDVVWVPTPQELVDKMLNMAKLTPSDFLMDLGSGDGRLVITAAKRGVSALGIEYNPDLVKLSKHKAELAGVGNKAEFKQADLFEIDLSRATVITLFLLTELNIRLRPRLLELKPGTRIVSNTFRMGDWHPDEVKVVNTDCIIYCEAFLWIVPAKIEGKWDVAEGELILDQKYQMFSGEFRQGNSTSSISEGRLKGNELTFKINGVLYTGTVSDSQIQGSYEKNGKTINWSASRID